MQLYALDDKGETVGARRAERQRDYFCFECGSEVRLRWGSHRQPHFYHISSHAICRQNQKGADHIKIQSYLINQLPWASEMECPFPTIRRIADVAWHSQRIVFEIQCSPINRGELLARNRDYLQEGWTVIWILHDKRYNQKRLSDAEMALGTLPKYFTNIDQWGRGIIYDQFDQCVDGQRMKKMAPLPINFGDIPQKYSEAGISYPLKLLEERSGKCLFYFSGDLMSLSVSDPPSGYLTQAKKCETAFNRRILLTRFNSLIKWIWKRGILLPYRILFTFLMEKACIHK
jgi:competence protein CoiA